MEMKVVYVARLLFLTTIFCSEKKILAPALKKSVWKCKTLEKRVWGNFTVEETTTPNRICFAFIVNKIGIFPRLFGGKNWKVVLRCEDILFLSLLFLTCSKSQIYGVPKMLLSLFLNIPFFTIPTCWIKRTWQSLTCPTQIIKYTSICNCC